MTKRILRCRVEFTPIYYGFFYIKTACLEKMHGVHAAIRQFAAKWVKRREEKRKEEKRKEEKGLKRLHRENINKEKQKAKNK